MRSKSQYYEYKSKTLINQIALGINSQHYFINYFYFYNKSSIKTLLLLGTTYLYLPIEFDN